MQSLGGYIFFALSKKILEKFIFSERKCISNNVKEIVQNYSSERYDEF